MPTPNVALQLYAVRHECERDLEGTLKSVASMGYDGVEFAGFYGRLASEIRGMLDAYDLAVAGAHVPLDTLSGSQWQSTVDYHLAIRNTHLIIPWLGESYRGGKDTWLQTATLFNRISANLRPHGLRTGYHNHNFEFRNIGGGETAWDIVAKNTDPDFVMQMDTGNALEGGADAAEYIRRYPNRSTTIHLKEYPDALLGDGKVSWTPVFKAIKEQDSTQWVIVEQEGDLYPPLQYVDRWLRRLRAHPDFAL
jgi:sugar phosphate isomerase/epimerase